MDERGQAAVESALVLPLAVFIILGLLQLGLMQQARLFADYAAYRGARTASLQMGDCTAVVDSELAALAPTLGRTDSFATWKQTFTTAQKDQGTGAGVTSPRVVHVVNFWKIDGPRATVLDDPGTRAIDAAVTSASQIERIHLRLYYLYELRIPFANWIISRLYMVTHASQFAYLVGGDPSGKVDALSPTRTLDPLRARGASGDLRTVLATFVNHGSAHGQFIVPLYASYSMRMFSPPLDSPAGDDGHSAYDTQPCVY